MAQLAGLVLLVRFVQHPVVKVAERKISALQLYPAPQLWVELAWGETLTSEAIVAFLSTGLIRISLVNQTLGRMVRCQSEAREQEVIRVR
jgi:hypothetical protein